MHHTRMVLMIGLAMGFGEGRETGGCRLSMVSRRRGGER